MPFPSVRDFLCLHPGHKLPHLDLARQPPSPSRKWGRFRGNEGALLHSGITGPWLPCQDCRASLAPALSRSSWSGGGGGWWDRELQLEREPPPLSRKKPAMSFNAFQPLERWGYSTLLVLFTKLLIHTISSKFLHESFRATMIPCVWTSVSKELQHQPSSTLSQPNSVPFAYTCRPTVTIVFHVKSSQRVIYFIWSRKLVRIS